MVSDMAKGEHAPHWAAWQKTQSGLMSQFLEDKTNQPLQPPEREDVDESGDGLAPLRSAAGAATENTLRRQLQFLLDGTAQSLFKRFADPAEKCRYLSITCTTTMILYAPDVSKHIPYLLPSVLSRYPPTFYDQEQQVFIHDLEQHEGYKRGVATARQDKSELVHSAATITVVEPSEEVRLLLCDLISSLLKAGVGYGTLSCLNPYFSDLVLILQSQLRDPYPALKCRASLLLVNLVRVPQWEQGAMVFATALARAAITNLRHRNAKVRVASLGLFEAAVGVPNRAKVRGAGTDAIADVVGFREENVLPIAAFYSASAGVQVNALAEVCQDGNGTVRARACAALCFFITCLPDRYDHHTRLLPYVLSFFGDDRASTREMAVQAIEHCGGQYEAEHPDDVIERRQYGVDGDSRTNVVDPLPSPFTERPRLGARLFVRGNTKRFFKALLKELTNWIETTRERSADLLLILTVYCEEHLTMDFHATLPLTVKALRNSITEGKTSASLTSKIRTILELMGRYVDPETYVPLLLPRVTGEGDGTSASEGGAHSEESRRINSVALGEMMKGSLTRQITPHVKAVVMGICEDCLTSDVSVKSRICFLETLNVLLRKVRGNDGKVLTGYFNATGRLADLDSIWMAVCRSLLFCQNNAEGSAALRALADEGLELLEAGESMNTNSVGLKQWAGNIHNLALAEVMEEGHAMWEFDGSDVRVLECLWNSEEAREGLSNSVGDLVMFGSWVVEGVTGEEFESEEVGKQCLSSWCNSMCLALGVVKSKVQRDSFIEDDVGVLLEGILLDENVWKGEVGEGRAKVVAGLLECLEKAGDAETAVWDVAKEWGVRLAKATAETMSCRAATALLDFVSAAVWGKDGLRLTSFAKSRAKKKRPGLDQVLRVLWPMAEELGSSYESLSVADKKLFGAFCNAAVYHLIEGEVSEKEEQEGAKAKEKPKRKTKIKLQRVEIEFTDSDSDGDGDDDEIDEATQKLAEEAAKLMAAGRTEVAAGLKRVEILDEDEEEDDDDEVVDDVGKVNVDGRVGVTLSEYFDTLMPIGGTDWLKQGVDKLDDEAEFEAAAVYDGAMRLAAVLKPAVFIESAKEHGKRVNCNFYNGLIDHGELLQMLGGGGK
mmetsp:Transcript_8008/g.15970  ORF Transcript_8008/g.15970 Transcript_8008/m.15970 type:complete len:1121 (-) Transcript_8008:54-3416(-)